MHVHLYSYRPYAASWQLRGSLNDEPMIQWPHDHLYLKDDNKWAVGLGLGLGIWWSRCDHDVGWSSCILYSSIVFFDVVNVSVLWHRFVRNNVKISWNVAVNNVVHIHALNGTSQTSVVGGLSSSVMDHLTIVLMNTVLNITNQLEFVLMETGMLCYLFALSTMVFGYRYCLKTAPRGCIKQCSIVISVIYIAFRTSFVNVQAQWRRRFYILKQRLKHPRSLL